MKTILWRVLIFLLGFASCYSFHVYSSIRDAIVSAEQNATAPEEGDYEEQQFHKSACDLFYRGKLEQLADRLKIDKGEVSVSINGASAIMAPSTPVAEIVVSNKSQRQIVFYEPFISKLTSSMSGDQGVIRDQFSMCFQFHTEKRSHILHPGATISFPALFPVQGFGAHVISLSALFPETSVTSHGGVRWRYVAVAHAQYSLSVNNTRPASATSDLPFGQATNELIR